MDRKPLPPATPQLPLADDLDPLEVELAQTIIAAVEFASGLSVRLGIADGKFPAYVAAVMGPERMEAAQRQQRGPGTTQTVQVPGPQSPRRGRYGRGLPDLGGSARPKDERR